MIFAHRKIQYLQGELSELERTVRTLTETSDHYYRCIFQARQILEAGRQKHFHSVIMCCSLCEHPDHQQNPMWVRGTTCTCDADRTNAMIDDVLKKLPSRRLR